MRKIYNTHIEALRGFCAIIVVFHHILLYNESMGNQYNLPLYYGFPGHTMVLIFFILSGYVIGINYYSKLNFNIKDYITKRLIRLYPIYLFAVLFTAILFKEGGIITLKNLLFLQNIATPNLTHNNALWSLNHEIIYYILAIPILAYRINLKYIIPVLFTLLIVSVFFFPFPVIIEGYLVGSLFWLTGFQLGVFTIIGTFKTPIISNNKFLSVLFLLLASGSLNILSEIFRNLPTLHRNSRIPFDDLVSFTDFSVYFLCLYTILSMISRKWAKPIGILAYIGVCSAVVEQIVSGNAIYNRFFYIPFFLLCLSIFLLFYPGQLIKSLGILRYLGEISYGIYVFHLPIIYLMGKINVYNTTALSYFIRIVIVLTLVILVAHFLEKIVQHRIKSFLLGFITPFHTNKVKIS